MKTLKWRWCRLNPFVCACVIKNCSCKQCWYQWKIEHTVSVSSPLWKSSNLSAQQVHSASSLTEEKKQKTTTATAFVCVCEYFVYTLGFMGKLVTVEISVKVVLSSFTQQPLSLTSVLPSGDLRVRTDPVHNRRHYHTGQWVHSECCHVQQIVIMIRVNHWSWS